MLAEASEEGVEIAEGEGAEVGGDLAGRRRRRRGGRGRGRGHSHEEGEVAVAEPGEAIEREPEVAASSAPARPNQFGSVWDLQIGMAGRPEGLTPLTADEDDYAEPEIPEYLLAEKRRAGRGQGRGQGGGRGVRSAYASAVDRERYGRSSSRFPEPARQPQAQQPRRRDERPPRQSQPPQQQQQRRGGAIPRSPGRDSAEPWTEVPPELEEILRAQLSTKLSRQGAAPSEASGERPAAAAEAAPDAVAEPKTPGRRGGRTKVEAQAPAGPAEVADAGGEKPKPATRSRRKPAAPAEDGKATSGSSESGEGGAPVESAAPKRRAPARRKAAEPAGE